MPTSPPDAPSDPQPGARLTLKERLRSPHAWVSTTYFAEGFPYSIVNNIAELVFLGLGASVQSIGLTALFHLPWNLKFLWGPFIDDVETKRRFIIGIEIVLACVLVLMALAMQSPWIIGLSSVLFLVLAFLSATQDIAIDGFYLEGLDDRDQSKFVGYRAAAYRLATVFILGPFVVLTGWIGWGPGFWLAAVMMAAMAGYHTWALPKVEQRGQTLRAFAKRFPKGWLGLVIMLGLGLWLLDREIGWFSSLRTNVRGTLDQIPFISTLTGSEWVVIGLFVVLVAGLAALPWLRRVINRSPSAYARAFVDFLEQPKIGWALAFVVSFRVGESFLMKMRAAFLLRETGMAQETYGWVNGTLGFGATVVATLVGGWLISKHGLRRWLWPFVLAQNTLNLLYMGLAMPADPSTWAPPVVWGVILLEHAGAGLGTAVFMVYLMRCCDPRHKAAHMAILTALMSLGFTLAGAFSGFLAEAFGFAKFFGFTFLATIPSMLLLPFVPYLDGRAARGREAEP